MGETSEIVKHFDAYSERRDVFRKRGSYYHQYTENYLRFLIPDDASVLELGCGTGHTLANVGDPSRNTGIDISTGMDNQAKNNYPDMDFRVGDANKIELSGTYDIVLLMNTLGYLEDIQSALECCDDIFSAGYSTDSDACATSPTGWN